MNLDLIFLIVFGLIISLIMFINKKKVKLEKLLFPIFYIILYRTRFGLNLMEKFSKYSKFFKVFSFIAIIVGFAGMAFIFYGILSSALNILEKPTVSEAGAHLLLPGLQIPGLPKLSFFHWIIAIFVLVIVHEFSHGIIARLYNVKLKSSGFGVFGIILPIFPVAFVEPDEEQLKEKSKKAQLSVLSAGSFANFVTALLFFIILLFLINPFALSLAEFGGVQITDLQKNYPLEKAGAKVGEIIIGINEHKISKTEDLISALKEVKPGDKVKIITDNNTYNIIATSSPEDETKPYIGIIFDPNKAHISGFKKEVIDKYGNILPKILFWVRLLFYWIFYINLLVGFVNLLPLFITDGSRMFYIASLFFIKNENISKKLWLFLNLLCIFLIFINFLPSIIKIF